jgi:hypothetical protein
MLASKQPTRKRVCDAFLEAVTTHQEWMNQQRDMFAEASRWLFAMIRKSWTPPAQMLQGLKKQST